MIDTDKYKIEDDVVWIWNDHIPDEKGWVLWEYKECPAEKGGYKIYREGEDDERTHEPWFQVLPALKFHCDIDERMNAITDLPLIIQEVKRLQDALKEAVEVVKEMAGMAYNDADADKFANHALEFIGNVKEMIE